MATAAPAARSRASRIAIFTTTAVCVALLVVIAGAMGAYAVFLKQYNNRVAPGVMVAGESLEGMTYLEALDVLEQRVATVGENGVAVRYVNDGATKNSGTGDGATVKLPPVMLPSDAAGTEVELYAVDIQRALDSAYAVGRSGSVVRDAKDQLAAALWGREFPVDYRLNRTVLAPLIEEAFESYETAPVNATLAIDDGGTLEITPEREGKTVDIEQIVAVVESRVQTLSSKPIDVTLVTTAPRVTATDIEEHQSTVEEYLSRAPVTFTWEDSSWEVDRSSLGQTFLFKKKEVRIDAEALASAVEDAAEEIEVEATEARWKVVTDEATGVLTGLEPLTAPAEGRAIDAEVTADRLLAALQSGVDEPVVEIAVEVTPPQFTPETVGELGIKDILGTGHSNMSGSPVNRRGNIARGVELLNGLLVPPGEQFSLLNALKPFTADNGYLPELVIRGNETVPEIGGGLCQIGTTTFRATMGSGLKILKRQNHSYAVSYYADDRNRLPGTDATIYDPAPDFVFENDTPGYILLQTRIEGNDLYFDFWGTDDGRTGTFSPPVAYNWTDPPPLKEIETDTLAPGERKCTENAHRGVTAEFTYTVDYADDSKVEELYKSVYKPWQAVCLVGKQPEDDPDASAAETVSNDDTSDNGGTDGDTNDTAKKPKKKNGGTNAANINTPI